MPGQAGGGDEALAQRLLPLVRDGPVVGEDPALQLVQVGGGELHAAARAVAVLVVAPLEDTDHHFEFICCCEKVCLLKVSVCVCVWKHSKWP